MNRSLRILRELGVSDDKVVQIVTQEVCTCMAPVSVEDCKECTFRPSFAFLLRRLLDVEDYRDPVFVVFTDETLVCVRGVGLDNAVFFL